MNEEDLKAENEMYFRQILSLSNLMLEQNNVEIPNIMTIRDIAEAALIKNSAQSI